MASARLADPAEQQAGHRDAELGRRDEAIGVVESLRTARGFALPSPSAGLMSLVTLTSENSQATKQPLIVSQSSTTNRKIVAQIDPSMFSSQSLLSWATLNIPKTAFPIGL